MACRLRANVVPPLGCSGRKGFLFCRRDEEAGGLWPPIMYLNSLPWFAPTCWAAPSYSATLLRIVEDLSASDAGAKPPTWPYVSAWRDASVPEMRPRCPRGATRKRAFSGSIYSNACEAGPPVTSFGKLVTA
jgi:hypothetical protein